MIVMKLYKVTFRWVYIDHTLNGGRGYYEFTNNVVAIEVREVINYLEEDIKDPSSKKLEILEIVQIAIVDHICQRKEGKLQEEE